MNLRFLPILVIFASVSLLGQTKNPNPGNPGNPTRNPSSPGFDTTNTRTVRLEIQLTDENSQPLNNIQASVEISSMGTPVDRTFTGMDGRASFSLKPGNGSSFKITISGAQIETTTASFQLFPTEMSHNERIEVKFKKDARAAGPGGTVSAVDLNVPPKARKEFSKGLEEMNQGNMAGAKKHFEKAIQEYPKYSSAYNNLGAVEMKLKDPVAARAAFEKAFELNDKNADAATNLARIKLDANDFTGASVLLNKALTVQPTDPKALILLAYCQFNTQQFDAALASAEKVHQGELDHFPMAHLIAARVREMKGDNAGAQRQYEAYLKESPDGPQAAMAKEGLVRMQAKK